MVRFFDKIDDNILFITCNDARRAWIVGYEGHHRHQAAFWSLVERMDKQAKIRRAIIICMKNHDIITAKPIDVCHQCSRSAQQCFLMNDTYG